MLKGALTAAMIGLFAASLSGEAGNLENAFLNPSDETRPRCYWYWMDGQMTKEGITKDLEAMRRVGIGEAYIGVIDRTSGTPPGPGLTPLSGMGFPSEFLKYGGACHEIATFKRIPANTPLQPSGLLGPVKVLTAE